MTFVKCKEVNVQTELFLLKSLFCSIPIQEKLLRRSL
jgi:hypothetical protein